MAQFQFDATNVAPRQSREVMPSGWYLAAVTESEIGAGSNPGSTVIKTEMTIQAPPEFRGRKVFDNLNVKNANPKAEQIGNETVSSINHAIGKLRILDTNEWHGVPMAIRLSIEKATLDEMGNEKYPAKNKIDDYKPASHYKGDVGAQSPMFNPAAHTAQASVQGAATPGWGTPLPAQQVAPPAPVQAAPVTISPDGAWKLVNGAWVANTPPPAPPAAVSMQPPPPTAQAAAPQTPWPSPGAPAQAAAGPWAQG